MKDNSALFAFDAAEAAACGGPVCGTDEAGRGPLAGPVCAAAVILRPDAVIPGLDDSKKLSPARREALVTVIRSAALAWRVEMASVEEIEEKNILNASLAAMRRAVGGLEVRPGVVLIDGSVCRGFDGYEARALVKGDAKSAAVAAASVLAKVARDRYMLELDARYPGYGFARHKGYPTEEHYAAIRRLGPAACHRMSFLKNFQERHA